MGEDARAAATSAARISYGRLLSMLAARSRDIAASEDALSEAFLAALRVWPERGVPGNPEAWLLTAARRSLGHQRRHDAVRQAGMSVVEQIQAELEAREARDFPDERLKLLFISAHPAIEESVRTPLMLQVVLGLDAARIAAAFLVSPTAMGQRLVRAKAKIRDAGIAFETPDPESLGERLADVLSAIYAAYGTGWDAPPATVEADGDLAGEAIYLGRLVAAMLPDEPEAKGLLSLMLHCEARRAARRDASGGFVPLASQDATLWNRAFIGEAERLLVAASRQRRFGRYQTEAAIQSLHVQSAVTGSPSHDALVQLYDVLADFSPTIGVLVARAAAYGEGKGCEEGLRQLDELSDDTVASYQPYWSVKAHLLHKAGRAEAAQVARLKAHDMTEDKAVRAYLATTT